MYIIYFFLYSIINYYTDFGFEYSDGFELLWGSVVVAFIIWVIDIIIFRIAYDWTGVLSKLCDYGTDERKTTHWKFRVVFSIPILIFSLTPFCSMIMTPIVHSSFILVSEYYNNIMKQIEDVIPSSFQLYQ